MRLAQPRRAVGVRRNPCRLTSPACAAGAFLAGRRASWLRPLQLVRASRLRGFTRRPPSCRAAIPARLNGYPPATTDARPWAAVPRGWNRGHTRRVLTDRSNESWSSWRYSGYRCRDTQWKSTGVRGCAVDSWTTGPRTSLAISARSPSEAADPEEVCRRSCGRSSPGRSGAGRPPGVARLRCRARHGATRPGRWLTAGAEVAVVVARGPPTRLDGVARRLRARR